MSNENPSTFALSPSEIPLDLTLRRPEANEEDMNNLPYPRNLVRQISSPSNLEYHANTHYSQYAGSAQYSTDNSEPCTPAATPPPPSTHSGQSLTPPTNPCRSTNVSPTPYVENGYSDKSGDSSSFEGSILPKKRKNLWRPYDSRVAAFNETDRDSDSSDSNTSASDQEFKTPPMDPVKKRKMNMIQYSSNDTSNDTSKIHQETVKCPVEETDRSLDNESSHEKGNSQSSPEKYDESWNMSQTTENTSGYFTHMAEDLTKSQLSLLNSYPEAREKMISGLKKRDIFGWGLKLTKPSPESQAKPQLSVPTVAPISSQENHTQNVCQDGEKTYFELQTVRTNSSPQPTINEARATEASSAEKSPFKIPKYDVPRSNSSPATVQSKNKSPEKTCAKSNDSEKENVNVDADGKVYVQTRDNVIKTFNETKNVPVKTKKSISLIDLVEEIEATAKKFEEEDESERNRRNRQVTALLGQCNHVKLQALDFLMANVLIQDREPQYKQKNEKVQKMLKGDKIASVNMLDVLELQVEIGLN